MSNNYDKTNKGFIGKNDKKGNDKAPDYRGVIDIEGKEYEIACWVKTDKNGQKYFSTAQKLKQPKEVTAQSVAASQPKADETDLPF